MTHESSRDRKATATNTQRRAAPLSMIARKSSGSESSQASALRQRVGNQGMQRLIGEMSGNSKGAAAELTVSRPGDPHRQKADRVANPVTRMPSPVVQASLDISQPGDALEVEADSVADTVMRMSAPPPQVPGISAVSSTGSYPSIRRICADCADKLPDAISLENDGAGGGKMPPQRKEGPASGLQVTPAVEANVRALQGEGSPLPPATLDFFEARFGADFSQVRVNTGGRADDTAKSLGAKAFTVGQSITFGAGQYAPASQQGRHLLAHELTHVVQQDPQIRRRVSTSVQHQESAQREAAAQSNQQSSQRPEIAKTTDVPKIQRAWYNFDIPFTDYQFDPSLQGIKTAATVVTDTAVAGLEWIVDEIKSLVYAGIDWLGDKWDSIKAFASTAFNSAKDAFANIIGFIRNPLGFLADALMRLDAEALAAAWARFSLMVSLVASGFKVATDTLLNGVNSIWGGINGYATSLLNRVSSLTNNFVFRKLPDAVQQVAFTVINQLKSLWKSINDAWTGLFNKIKTWVEGALDTVFSFVRKVLSFGINVVIAGIIAFGQIVLFLKDLFSNPKKYIDILAARSVQAFGGVESRFAGLVGQYFGSAKTAAPAPAAAIKVHRAPAAQTAAEAKRSATWAEMGHGIAAMMGKKWNEFKSNPLSIVKGLLMDMVLPIVGNVKDVIQLFTDIKNIVTGPLSAGSLEELWTSLLQILDIPILIYHTVVSILMRSLMLPLIVATFIPHPVVKGIAAAVGYALLGAFVQAEGLNLTHKVLLLKTGVTTKAQKEEAYNRVADSLIALAMTAAIIVVMLILHFIANVMKGVYNFVKGKVFGVEPTPVEGKATAPGEGKGAKSKTEKPESPSRDLGTQDGKKVLAEEPTADGKHQVKVTEEGIRCCSPSCPFLIEDIDAAVLENPALKEKLDPLRKRLEAAQGELESARLREDRAVNPQEAAKAAADVEKAAQAAADVAAEVKPEIDKVIRDSPLPSGLRFNEYNTPEAAIGMKEGRAQLVNSDPVKEPALRDQGYTDRHYYRDQNGKKWSVDVRKVDGKPVYKEGKPSSGQEVD